MRASGFGTLGVLRVDVGPHRQGLIWAIPCGVGVVNDFFAAPPGRPGGRNVDSKPRRLAVACCRTGSPNGLPPCVLRRNAISSASVSIQFT